MAFRLQPFGKNKKYFENYLETYLEHLGLTTTYLPLENHLFRIAQIPKSILTKNLFGIWENYLLTLEHYIIRLDDFLFWIGQLLNWDLTAPNLGWDK